MTEVIVALDVDSILQEEELLQKLHGTISYYKIGMRLFAAHGKRAIDLVHRFDGKVFLDLKFMDIPQTVEDAVRQSQRLGAFAVSVHLWGGTEMLKAAASVHPRPKLWGVTVLTSMTSEDLSFLHPALKVRPTVTRLARLAKANRLDGIICSAQEVAALSKTLGSETCFITPGIRPVGAAANDQRRVMTPADATRLGIRYLVIGRPITSAPDPLKAAQNILREMKLAMPRGVEAA